MFWTVRKRSARLKPPLARWLRHLYSLAAALILASWSPSFAVGIGESTRFEVRSVDYDGGNARPRESAPRRLAWEIRKRTSVDTRLRPGRVRLDDASIFETPFLYWAGSSEFPSLSDAEIVGLRRFVQFGGFVLIDDASPGTEGFERSVRRALRRAFPNRPLRTLPNDHTIFRAFYLLRRPLGRVRGPEALEGITFDQRVGVVLSRHDLGGAWARDSLGSWEYPVTPGGSEQREAAMRLGVNLVLYSLCLDYKDDQVHAPFIMRRRGGSIP